MSTRKRVLILGGGFGGVYAAMHLDKTLARDPDVEVTLVSQDNFLLFTPMLHEVASGDLDLTHIVNPLRKLLRNVAVFNGCVENIDLENRRVTVNHGSDLHMHDLEYDYLLIALGAVTNFFHLPGLEERCLTMKSLGDAIYLRNRVIAQMEEADTECAAGIREPLLTFVVAGGGFAGVETIAAINDFVREALPFYPQLSEKMVRMVLVHPGETVLTELDEKLGAYAQKKLAERGVEIRGHTKVASMTDDAVTLTDGTVIPTRIVIWTAGVSPNPLVGMLPCHCERGRIVTNEFLEASGHPGVWALGDCASVPDPATGKPYPPTAQHAIRQGKVAAHNIRAMIRGGDRKPFFYKSLGQMASIGHHVGVASVMGHNFSGFLAWFMWRSIYLSKLPRFEKKVRVALDWTLDLLFSRDFVQYLTLRSQGISHMEDEMPVPQARREPVAPSM